MLNLIRAEFIKYKRSFVPYIHIFLPIAYAILIASYGNYTSYKEEDIVSAYLESIGLGLPVIISLICAKVADSELQAGNFLLILSNVNRKKLIVSKAVALLSINFLAILTAVTAFACLYNKSNMDISIKLIFYTFAVLLLFASNVFLYILLLFVGLRYGRGIAIGLGIAQALTSALFLTGLGDRLWYFTPWTWGARLMGVLSMMTYHTEYNPVCVQEMTKCILFAIPITILAIVLILMWFDRWEG